MSEKVIPVVINIYNGTGSVFTVDLNSFGKNKVTFGNSSANDIVIDSPTVSENHGYFQFTNVGWVVFDNQSKNGIVVNSTKRKDVKLSNGMEIRIADEDNKTLPAVTMFVDIKEDTVPVSATSSEPKKEEPEATKPKKKSKAPIIIVIILVVLFVLGIIGFLILGALGILGVGAFALFNKKTDIGVEMTTAPYVDITEIPTDDVTEEITTEVSTTVVPVELPERVPTAMYCEQFILAKCNGTHTTLVLYEKEGDIWVEKATANGRIGKNGITENKHEGDGCTPAGEFDLTFCCGLSDPGTAMSFQRIDSYSVWVDDVNSRYYNTLQQSDSYYKDWSSAEPMYSSYFKNDRHNYCINIAANGDGIVSDNASPGCGSVITLCGKNDTLTETQGCVDISGDDMLIFLDYLDSAKNPVIIIY